MPPVPGAKPPFRQMGGKTIPMMANGGMGTPPPIGGMPDDDAPPAPPLEGADPDNDGDIDNPTIKPEMVNYHDDPHSCQTCANFGDDGQCEVLKMPVSPDGGCNAFASKGGDDAMGDMADGLGMPPPGPPPPDGPQG